MRTLQLLKKNVLVRVNEQTHMGRFFIPEVHRDQHDYRTGIVTHVGADVLDCKFGDEVVLDFGGQWVTLGGVLLAVVKEQNVLAVLEKE